MIWISLQDEGRMPWEREELMISATKEQSSFAHFFKSKGGIPRELSVEFDLMRDKSGRISELEAGLNTEGFKRGRGRRTGVSRTKNERLIEGINIYVANVTFRRD